MCGGSSGWQCRQLYAGLWSSVVCGGIVILNIFGDDVLMSTFELGVHNQFHKDLHIRTLYHPFISINIQIDL